jgi:rhodanese-related sulfurtransferase
VPTSTRTTFTAADLERLRAERPDVRVLDVRTPGEFAARHIPGSYNVPLPDLGEHRAELTAGDAGPVVVVCESGRRAGMAEQQLVAAGLDRIHVLDGGVAAWERSGHELARPDDQGAPWALERQVRLVAGSIVLAAIVVSVAWPPARYLAGAVGAGLVIAALTDTCAMGMLLGRLPYNRRTPTCDMPSVVARITQPEEVAR